jgi:hypothetical protein
LMLLTQWFWTKTLLTTSHILLMTCRVKFAAIGEVCQTSSVKRLIILSLRKTNSSLSNCRMFKRTRMWPSSNNWKS